MASGNSEYGLEVCFGLPVSWIQKFEKNKVSPESGLEVCFGMLESGLEVCIGVLVR